MKRCLIVEDSDVIRKVATRILSSDTMRVMEARTATDALAQCGAETPDFIILDSTLPDMSPVQFLTALKECNLRAWPVVLLMITELDIVPIMRAKRVGAAGYLLKPFDRTQLLTAFSRFSDDAASAAA